MVDPRIESMAKLGVQYSVDVKSGNEVLIQGSELAFPLMKELYKECLLRGAHPMILPTIGVDYTFFKFAKEHQLKYLSPIEKFFIENVDVAINVFCEPNPKRLTNIESGKIAMFKAARKEIMDIVMKRMTEGKLRWMALPFPIASQAQEAAMSLEEYEDFVYGSCMVDKEDPTSEWKKVREQQEKVCEYLNKADEIRVVGQDTDLSLNVKGRKWVNCSGRLNMPDGEVFTGPIEDSANGTIRFTFPGIVSGKEVEDIRLTFKDGRVVEATASKGEDLLKQMLKLEGADRVGEFAIGTNYSITKFTKNMLFDEKMGGTLHMAIGASIPESGGLNKSALHWDILKDMKDGEIFADGKVFYKNGEFLIE
jgi:aminopeptidase